MKNILIKLHCILPDDYSESEIDLAIKDTVGEMGGIIIETEKFQNDSLYYE